MAEYVLKKQLKDAKITDIRVKSAGLTAAEGEKINKLAAMALMTEKIKSYSFRSKQLTPEMIKKSDMVICMTASQKSVLSVFKNVYTISELSGGSEIPDPYGGDAETYLFTFARIKLECENILNRILKAKGGL